LLLVLQHEIASLYVVVLETSYWDARTEQS